MPHLRHLIIVLQSLLAIAGTAAAQTQYVGTTNFPAELEFRELQAVTSDKSITDASALSQVKDGKLFIQAGLSNYLCRTYALADKQSLIIEDLTFRDWRAAFSLVTLLRKSALAKGPPGDIYSIAADVLIFSQSDHWVRIQGNISQDLLKRVAISVGNRIGRREQSLPILISHFPKNGFESPTLRYFPGPFSSETYSPVIAGRSAKFESDLEVAQADYAHGNQQGMLSLINFPTIQMAEDYFDNVGGLQAPEGQNVYMKRAGPLLGVLEGTFDRNNANTILKPVEFTYSVKWIYDKNSRNSAVVWGVPVEILGTVVRSILLTGLFCCISIVAGASFAIFRLLLRGYAPNNYLDRPERTEIIRLKINEN
jgi:hypothetical protein